MTKRLSKDQADRMRSEVFDLYQDAVACFQSKRANRTIENAAFFRGLQHIFRTKTNAAIELADPRGESAEVVNFTRTLINAAVSATLGEIPSPEIPSAKGDERSKAKARMSEMLARSAVRNNIINYDELYRCVSWAKQAGLGWLKVCWDPDAGRAIPQQEDGFDEDAPDPYQATDVVDNGFGELVTRQIYEGEVSVQFVPTVDGLPDPAARCRREMQHFFHRKLRPVRELANRYPVDYFGDPTGRRWHTGRFSIEQQSYRAIADDGDTPFGGFDQNARASQNVFAEIVEFWEMPSRKFPQGRLIIFSDKMIVWAGPIPYKPARLPFVPFYGDNIVASTFFPDGLVEDIKWMQRATNKVESKKMEIINKMANPHLMVPYQSGIDTNTWGDIPGQVIRYNKGFLPTIMPAAEVPQSMFTHANDQFERAKFMSGYTDMAAGDIPADASGRAVAFATENEGRLRKPVMNYHVLSMVETMQHYLWLSWQYYDDGRIVRMTGDNGPELTEFRLDDYDTINDLEIDLFSGAPSSHAARFSQALSMMEAGLFGDAPEAERARRMMGSDWARKSYFDPFQEDRDRAKREQLMTIENPYYQASVKTYDIHRVHLEEHNRWRKTLEYEELTPQQQDAFDMHCELHEMLMQAGQLAQMGIQTPPGDIDQAGAQQQPMALGPGPAGEQKGQPSPIDGGHNGYPSPPQTVKEFARSSPGEQNAADQK